MTFWTGAAIGYAACFVVEKLSMRFQEWIKRRIVRDGEK